MTTRTHLFQAPKGTRDFLPDDLAVRRHIEAAWRGVSINHGFDEIDGPTFEHLDLYTVKSGPGIVSELFSFRRAGGDTDYALRPEFTPTLARMVARIAHTLPRPTKWFCIPAHFRAERPQRGRLREFFQWNADVIGDETPGADAEVVAVTVGVLAKLGLGPDQVQVKISDRRVVTSHLTGECGVAPEQVPAVLDLLDRRDRLPAEEFARAGAALGFDDAARRRFEALAGAARRGGALGAGERGGGERGAAERGAGEELAALLAALDDVGIADWCHVDLSIVRGLAYYTGSVFEVHETTGRERAIAGGGRYDELIGLFGGPSTPAVGLAMGDVVIRLVLEDHGLLERPEAYLPRPHAFVINGLDDGARAMHRLVADLRRAGLHVRHSYRATRNIGKLLGDAAKSRARYAVILGRELADGNVVVKDLDGGEQREVSVAELAGVLGAG